jgi:hypothetical protein
MQEPTHILAGIVIQKSFDKVKHRKLALGLTATVAFLSHGFLDKLANLTYHPAAPDFHSVFWVSFHTLVAAATVFFLYLWWKKFKWGIFFAALPDVDWIFIHGQQIFHFQIPFYRQPHLHHLLNFIYEKIPPFSFVGHWLDKLPSFRHDPWACLVEVLLGALLWLTFKLMKMIERPAPPLDDSILQREQKARP